jgi:hypothetical protein
MYPALDIPVLLATPVEAALSAWTGLVETKRQVTVAEIDPELSDTAAFRSRYCVSPNETADCVIVVVRRGGETTWAAAVVLAATRLDVNGLLRRHLGARKVSLPGWIQPSKRRAWNTEGSLRWGSGRLTDTD